MDANNTPAVPRQGPFWTRAKEGRLISLYGQFSLLWDNHHREYYNKDRRDHAMRAIAAGLDNEFDERSVKGKIKSLRDYFLKELKKERYSTSRSPTDRYVSTWEHFDAWHFLRCRVICSAPAPLPSANVPFSRQPSSVQRVASGAHSNGLPGIAAYARGQASVNNGGFAESKDHRNALYCGYLLLQLRGMPNFERNEAKLRLMQMLFNVEYQAEHRAAMVPRTP